MKLKVCDIAEIINGKITGNPNIYISSFSNIEDAQSGDVTFLSDMKYKKHVKATKASLIIIPKININTPITTIAVDDPITKFSKIINLLQSEHHNHNTISDTAEISKSTNIDNNVSIGSYCVIRKNCQIGPNWLLQY